jgi:hypothetical protein
MSALDKLQQRISCIFVKLQLEINLLRQQPEFNLFWHRCVS